MLRERSEVMNFFLLMAIVTLRVYSFNLSDRLDWIFAHAEGSPFRALVVYSLVNYA